MEENELIKEISQTAEKLEVKVLKKNPVNKKPTGFKAVFTKDFLILQKQ